MLKNVIIFYNLMNISIPIVFGAFAILGFQGLIEEVMVPFERKLG